MATPYMLRWLNTVADDDSLTYRAKSVAALSIFRHADMRTGKNCRVGIPKMAAETGLGQTTVKRGLAELEDTGYLDTDPLPASKWNKEGALRHPESRPSRSPAWSLSRTATGYPVALRRPADRNLLLLARKS